MKDVDLTLYAGRRVAVALSGGADSVALFLLFCERKEALGIALSAVHVEHGIRGEESLADAAFVRALCEQNGVPLRCFSADIPALCARSGRGTEEEARLFRRAVFFRLIEEGAVDFVATAHHAGDNAESVLFSLFRGASLTGGGGIRAFVPAADGKGIVRPFLSLTEAEIAAFLAERRAAWREDATNADPSYARNFLRHKVLAPAKERFPALEKNVYAFSRAAREDDDYLYSLTDRFFEEGEECVIRPGAPPPVLRRCCVRALRALGAEKDYTSAHIAAMCALFGKRSGAAADLPCGLKAVNDYGSVAVYRPRPSPAYRHPFGTGVFACGGVRLCIAEGEGEGLRFDASRLPAGAVIRPREAGDVFCKFGGGTKKLKEYFIDEKIPARRRDLFPLVACGKEVFVVCGAEISEKVRVRAGGKVYTAIVCKGENEE